MQAMPAAAQVAYAVDDGLDVGGVDQNVDGVDVGEAFEQRPLALHHRLCRLRAEVAEPEDGGAVGDDGHQVGLVGVVVGQVRIPSDGEHRHGHAGRVGQRQIALGGERLGRCDLELAGLALAVEQQRFLLGEARCSELDGHVWSGFPQHPHGETVTIGLWLGLHNCGNRAAGPPPPAPSAPPSEPHGPPRAVRAARPPPRQPVVCKLLWALGCRPLRGPRRTGAGPPRAHPFGGLPCPLRSGSAAQLQRG